MDAAFAYTIPLNWDSSISKVSNANATDARDEWITVYIAFVALSPRVVLVVAHAMVRVIFLAYLYARLIEESASVKRFSFSLSLSPKVLITFNRFAI